MIEEYLEYWRLTQGPFLLAPDSRMMCVTGQYYECLERVKYAIKTGKGGVLIASEDAGLGKTTSLLRLVDDMKEKHGDAFRYAYVDHPTLSPSQIIAQITSEISGAPAGEDKLANLNLLKENLIQAREQGGRSVIIVDEAQLLCGTPDILQELRMLINLTHDGDYLHTFILSGQRALWHTVKNMPEFWQRLPVRFYFLPLKLEETKQLVRHRLSKAGIEEGREVFSNDALEILNRYSKGSPRTVLALADLSLLVGYTNKATRIGFQEVLKAINAMSGQGDSLPYVGEKHEPSPRSVHAVEGSAGIPPWRATDYPAVTLRTSPIVETTGSFEIPRPVFAVAAILVLIIAAFFVGYRYISNASPPKSIAAAAPAKTEEPQSPTPEVKEPAPAPAAEEVKAPAVPAVPPPAIVPAEPKEKIVYTKEAVQEKKEPRAASERTATVVVEGANVRSSPRLGAAKVDLILKDQTVKVVDQKQDSFGRTWYMVNLPAGKKGWIHENVLELH